RVWTRCRTRARATPLGWKSSRRITARTRSRVARLTGLGPSLITYETVAVDTPLSRATSRIVATAGLRRLRRPCVSPVRPAGRGNRLLWISSESLPTQDYKSKRLDRQPDFACQTSVAAGGRVNPR